MGTRITCTERHEDGQAGDRGEDQQRSGAHDHR